MVVVVVVAAAAPVVVVEVVVIVVVVVVVVIVVVVIVVVVVVVVAVVVVVVAHGRVPLVSVKSVPFMEGSVHVGDSGCQIDKSNVRSHSRPQHDKLLPSRYLKSTTNMKYNHYDHTEIEIWIIRDVRGNDLLEFGETQRSKQPDQPSKHSAIPGMHALTRTTAATSQQRCCWQCW